MFKSFLETIKSHIPKRATSNTLFSIHEPGTQHTLLTFEEMFACATTDSNDPEGPIVTKSRPSSPAPRSPAPSDNSVGLTEGEFRDLAQSLEVTTIPASDTRALISKPKPSLMV